MSLFFIGVVEMLIVTVWTKSVSQTQVVMSGVITLINVLVWYYVIQQLIDNIHNWQVAIMYALGCAFGTVIATYQYKLLGKKKSDNI